MKVTVPSLIKGKAKGESIAMLTAWDYPIASLLDQAGIDIILVGDSLAMVALGHDNTLPITLEQMIYHAQAVCRGVKNALVVVDLPFLTYQESVSQAIHSAGRVLKETPAQGVKLEGGSPQIIETITRLTSIGIPVMAHLGLTPQSVHQLGYKKQGKMAAEQEQIIKQATAVEEAGAFSLVLEHIPANLAAQITHQLKIPTIGIGAGPNCDGQVLVTADLLGLSAYQPPFAKVYVNLRQSILEGTQQFIKEVKNQEFPE